MPLSTVRMTWRPLPDVRAGAPKAGSARSAVRPNAGPNAPENSRRCHAAFSIRYPSRPELEAIRRSRIVSQTNAKVKRAATSLWNFASTERNSRSRKWQDRSGHHPFVTGVLSTAGSVAFVVDLNRMFRAFDANAGRILWETQLPTAVQGFLLRFTAGGKQYWSDQCQRRRHPPERVQAGGFGGKSRVG